MIDSPFVITIKDNANDETRIGPHKRSPKSESAILLEELVKKNAPLPTTYDVAPIQDNYFTEFSYLDFNGGLVLQTLSAEVTASIMEYSIKDVVPDYSLVDKFLQNIHDKYILENVDCPANITKIAFMPGTNLIHCVNRELLDRELFYHDDLLIKPHPLTSDETLRHYGINYGYARVIDKQVSGMAFLKNAEVVYTASNSEMGLVAVAMKKRLVDMTSLSLQPRLSYSSFYRLFSGDIEHNYETFAKILTSKTSGVLMPFFDDNQERIESYFSLAMNIRELYRPKYPATIYKFEHPKVLPKPQTK